MVATDPRVCFEHSGMRCHIFSVRSEWAHNADCMKEKAASGIILETGDAAGKWGRSEMQCLAETSHWSDYPTIKCALMAHQCHSLWVSQGWMCLHLMANEGWTRVRQMCLLGFAQILICMKHGKHQWHESPWIAPKWRVVASSWAPSGRAKVERYHPFFFFLKHNTRMGASVNRVCFTVRS
jgi:hypothetical protein